MIIKNVKVANAFRTIKCPDIDSDTETGELDHNNVDATKCERDVIGTYDGVQLQWHFQESLAESCTTGRNILSKRIEWSGVHAPSNATAPQHFQVSRPIPKRKKNNNSKWWVNIFNGIVWILSWIIHTSYSILTKKKDLIRLSYYQTKGFTRSNILMNVKHLNIWIHHSS